MQFGVNYNRFNQIRQCIAHRFHVKIYRNNSPWTDVGRPHDPWYLTNISRYNWKSRLKAFNEE